MCNWGNDLFTVNEKIVIIFALFEHILFKPLEMVNQSSNLY